MKQPLAVILFALLLLVSLHCRKKNDSCRSATIHHYYTCSTYALQFDNDTVLYQCFTLPPQYQQEGLRICVTYTTYDNMSACPSICCSGKVVNILSIR